MALQEKSPFLGLFRLLCVPVYTVEVFECDLQPFAEALFRFAQPHAGIVVLFIWLGRSFGVAQLALEVAFILFVIIFYPFPESPLEISIDIHLDGAVADGFPDLMLGAAAAAMEYEVDGFGACF
jgi:hypothetical protein